MSDPKSPPVWPLQSSERLHEYEMFSVHRDRARDPETGEVRDLHIADSPGGVVVLARSGSGELVLVEQFRHGLRELSLELPAGVVDEGEDPVAAGMRELREETGYVSERGELLGTMTLNPSWQSSRVHVVLARDAEAQESKSPDEGEDTRVRCIPLERVREMVRGGEIQSAVSLAALLFLDLQG